MYKDINLLRALELKTDGKKNIYIAKKESFNEKPINQNEKIY